MGYRVEVSPKADAQLAELDPTVGSAVERKIVWLAENAAVEDGATINREHLADKFVSRGCVAADS